MDYYTPIILLLRLVRQDCWLVVALGQTERFHGQSDAQQFCCCCLIRDALGRKRFFINLHTMFWRKGARTVNLEKKWVIAFLHE
jgi:hypothetical protein